MKRRKALKNIGVSIGAIMATPAVMTLLQGCQNEVATAPWNPVFFSTDQSVVLKNIVDLILPKTEKTPGAIDLNIHVFLDLFIGKTYKDETQKETKEGFDAIMKALNVSESNPVSNLEEKDYDTLLAKYFRATKEEKEKYHDNENDKSIMDTLGGIRWRAVWAYKKTKEIGEDVLAYDPVPGSQIGCMSLEEATGGMEWSG